MVEVDGIGAASGTILLTPNECRVADDRCDREPTLQDPIKDPACLPWREVTKVAHYWLEVDALTKPMQVREDSPPYGCSGNQ